MGETPTTGARDAAIASRTPGTARIGPIETTGLLGQTTIARAPRIASSTPGAGRARRAAERSTASTSEGAPSRTMYSSKWSFRPPDSSTRVGQGSFDMGRMRTGTR